MRRFMGMMPMAEVEKQQSFKDRDGYCIMVQAGPNGWTIIWGDYSTDYRDVTATTTVNWQAALDYLANKGFKDLTLIATQRG
jgi:topoisomerase IA-like protein